ncbi:winged helix-turn-helix domain-containing protein [Natronincola ferrireducens]|uniref:Molybdate transport system regulatory protein n=1 Tax=Natronincola ferrireducens TaxID=393762 RepID=A0A1G8ZPP1_9FIRM|nr:LysR family transcriptional regulator [Natronincola ferrireducens]SDK16997.1 molybdate transport system regulatory protein [Natronincola ferrireducens]
MEYKFRIWLTQNNNKVFGEGPLKLLKKIEELGSLRQAAISMEMSYSKAWKIIKNIEEELQIPILERHIGGKKGGGSTITKEARDFIHKYEVLKSKIETMIQKEIQSFLKD